VIDPLQVPLWIDLVALTVGALAGATIAVEEKFDVVGLLFLAIVMGLGGGIIRDILLGLRPVALTNEAYLPAVVIAGVVGVLLVRFGGRARNVWIVLDALALGLFTVVGVEKSLLNGLAGTAAVFIGVSAAVGGGVLRDIACNRPIELVRRGTWNGAAALLGAWLYVGLAKFDVPSGFCEFFAIATIVAVRLASVWRGWETPGAELLAQPIPLPRLQYRRPEPLPPHPLTRPKSPPQEP
jgi:uncharacterized membrane protein YeiH